jgi:hypothetical protein
MSFETLLQAIHLLAPTGQRGFEGLIARLLERLTGQRFFLALSGQQGGQDLASESRTGNKLAVECKRYREDTPLSADELVAKLTDAANGPTPPDIWMVVATKRLGDQHHKKLERVARTYGISYFPIDINSGDADGELSPLAVLLATDPGIVMDHLRRFAPALSPSHAEEIARWLTAHAARHETQIALERLRCEFLAENVGYEHWRQAQNGRFLEVIADTQMTKAVFEQDLAVRGPAARLVRRDEISNKLDTWWANWHERPRFCVILGEEGDGKTWAMADWLADRVADPDFPPVLFIPSGEVVAKDPRDLMIGAIRRSLGHSGVENWITRLERWLRPPRGDVPRVLLVLDGLNERPSGPWAALLAALSALPWIDTVAVSMTCRTLFWDEQLAHRVANAEKIAIIPYDDRELDVALPLRGLTRRDVDDRVLPLLRKPRYLDLMARLRGEMADAGEVTVERLIYEDQRDKWSRRQSGVAGLMNHEGFQEFLYSIAQRLTLEQRVPRPELMRELDAFGNGQDLLTELTTGRVLNRVGVAGWTVDRRYLVLGLGLLLAETARQAAQAGTDTALDEAILQLIEPQPDMDIKVEICGFALLHALLHLDQGFTMPVRLALFRTWIRGRNIHEADWRRLPAYLPLSPETYLEMAEVLWAMPTNNAEAQDAFMAGFLRYARSPRVHEALVPAFERWLGFTHPDGHKGRHARDDLMRLEAGRHQVRTALGGDPNEGPWDLFGYRLTITREPGVLRLSQVALAVISHLDRSPFLRGIVTGILADQAMGYPSHPELLYWTVRTAPDPIEAPLLEAAWSLIAQGSETAQKTADMLLAAVCTEGASNAREQILEPYRYRHPLRDLWERDPCRFNLLWDAETSGLCLERMDVPLSTKLRLSKTVAIDPATVFPLTFIDQLEKAEFDFDLAQICSNVDGVTSEDHDIREIEPAVCAAAPQRMAEFERSLARCLKFRQGDGLRLLVFRVFQHLMVMQPDERQVIVDSWRDALQESGDSIQDSFVESILFQCVLWEADAETQLSFWLQRQGKCNYSPGYRSPVAPIVRCLADHIAKVLPNIDDDAVRFNLLMLLNEGLCEMTDALRGALLALCRNAGARYAFGCRRLFLRLDDYSGASQIISGGAEFIDPDAVRTDPYASLLVCKFGVDLPFDVVIDRVAPEFLGLAVHLRGREHSEIARFGSIVNETLDRSELAIGEVPPEAASAMIEVDWCGLDDLDLHWDLAREPQRKIQFLSMDGIWGGNIGRDNKNEWPWTFPSGREITRQSNELRKSLGDFINERLEQGCDLIARRFETAALDAVIEACPGLVKDWLERILRNSPSSGNLLIACRGFYESLCQVLLNAWPQEGVALFRRLDACPAFRLIDRATEIDNLRFALFQARPGTIVNALREELFDRCVTDEDLFELTFVAQFATAHDWLDGQIFRWSESSLPFDRARGIFLLGLLDAADAGARLADMKRTHDRSWLGSCAEAAERIHRCNQWAKSWFQRFLTVEDDIKGWAAFRLFLRCVDQRFWIWGPTMVEAHSPSETRRLHYVANRRAIAASAHRNERDPLKLHERLVGEKVLEEKAWPWMGRFLYDRSEIST